MVSDPDRSPALPPLYGLVLAGGHSVRMGQDKGLLVYHGIAQVLWLRELLCRLCAGVYVSVNARQRAVHPYAGLPVVVDVRAEGGPAIGLLSAWEAFPESAWLAVGVDLPFVDERLLAQLVEARRPGSLAAAFRQPDGILEPVCTLWEPAARAVLAERLAAADGSLRRMLEAGPTVEVPLADPRVLRSINTPQEYRDARARLPAPDRNESR